MQSTKLHANTSYIKLQANLFLSIPWRHLWTSTPQTVLFLRSAKCNLQSVFFKRKISVYT